MMSDEDYARMLQEEFDKEENALNEQNEQDALLAQKLAKKSHNISDSESEDEDDSIPIENDEPVNKIEVASDNPTLSVGMNHCGSTSDLEMNSGDAKSESASESQSNINKLPICKYGKKCFRKNPAHFLEFGHPDKSSNSDLQVADRSTSDEPSPKRLKKDDSRSTQNSNGSKMKNNIDRSKMKKSFPERLSLSNPFRLFLNKNFSVPGTADDWLTLVFPDLLNPKLGTLIESAQINFMVDLNFVMDFFKACGVAKTPVLFMYGELEGDPKDYDGVTCTKVHMPFLYGVHHSKMMLFHYKEGLRVVVHTANLVPDDWSEKTQGYWISPLFPALDKPSILDGESSTGFKKDLIDYILSYKSPDLTRWSHILKAHDFSSCRVFFIGSVPGYHIGETRLKYGHMKCRNLLRKYSSWSKSSNQPVIAQCSSIGTLGKDSNAWLTNELGVSLSGGNDSGNSTVKLIYPSENDVKNSSQGYGGGFCLPYSNSTHLKQLWLQNHLHLWRSNARKRTRAMPHIKTYTRLSVDLKAAQFFVLTSSNLSKAAWGMLQKQGSQLFIRSYEAGIMFLPKFMVDDDKFSLCDENEDHLSLPYDLPLTRYAKDDNPWLRDTPKDSPDVFGETYP